jgi:hypothetical protein
MSRLKGVFSWRVLAAAAGLLLLSALAPLVWQPEAKESISDPRDWRPLGGESDRPILPAPLAIGNAPVLEPTVVLASHRRPAGPPQFVQYGPPVADRFDLDPSVTETPALPPRTALKLPSARDVPALPSGPDGIEGTSPDSADPITEPPSAIRPEPPPEPELPKTNAWPLALALVEQLDGLAAAVPLAAEWAASVKTELETLSRLPALDDPQAAAIIGRLNVLADEGKQLALSLPGEDSRSRLLRAGYAIVRRVVIWDLVQRLAAQGDVVAPILDRAAWDRSFAQVEHRLEVTHAAGAWRTYLMLDEARTTFDSENSSPEEQRQLARDILHRLHSTQLSHDQEQFLRAGPMDDWVWQLYGRAAETPDVIGLLEAMERLEQIGLSADTRSLADHYDQLRWSSDAGIRKLAATVNAYYRNANVRVALSAELVNRMLPRTRQQYEPVQDTILEAKVEGDSFTSTQLRMVLVPDRTRWNIGLEAVGEVASNTSSSKGPATFYQNGVSFFRARKRVTVDRRGIRLQNAEANANANNNLDDFETDFDGIPLFGNLARAIARNQYETSQPAAKVEVEGKIVWRATSQLDREVAEKLEQSKQDFQVRMLDPLRKLDLEPTAVEMETTAERLIARYRLAGRDQVSAHTPRPQAPGDSLLSVQIHETALNNVLEHLKLNGTRVELRELFRQMTGRFNREPVPVPDDLPEGVFVTFADEDPVRIDCQDGRVRLTIRMKELSQEGTRNRWRDFTVRGYYQPVADQLDANLEREGVIELIGDRLRFGDQIALRGIFSAVLSRNRKLNLINKQIAQAPELRDQQVTQFVIHDGWIGVALGPKSPGRTAAMSPRPDLGTRTE